MAARKRRARPTQRELQAWAEKVRRRFKLDRPIVVRYGPCGKGLAGWCDKANRQRCSGVIIPMGHEFHILIADRLRELESVESVLEHELAHALSWDAPSAAGRAAHGPEFGLAWAAVHRCLANTK